MNPREAAEEEVEQRPARDVNAGRNAERNLVGAASAASTSGKVTGQGRGLIEQMIHSENLNLAWKKVARNKGAAGGDGLDLEATMKALRTNRQRIEAELLAGTYVPQPVRRVEIPKASGGTRVLGVPTVQDRWDPAGDPSGDRPAGLKPASPRTATGSNPDAVRIRRYSPCASIN